MNKLDQAIRQALSAEDAEFLARFEGEAPLSEQVLATFKGSLGALSALGWIVGFAAFAGVLYCGWHALNAPDARGVVLWSAGASLAMLAVAMIKIWFWMEMQANRVMREVKRLELQVARLAAQR